MHPEYMVGRKKKGKTQKKGDGPQSKDRSRARTVLDDCTMALGDAQGRNVLLSEEKGEKKGVHRTSPVMETSTWANWPLG